MTRNGTSILVPLSRVSGAIRRSGITVKNQRVARADERYVQDFAVGILLAIYMVRRGDRRHSQTGESAEMANKREFTIKKTFRQSTVSRAIVLPIVRFDAGTKGAIEFDSSQIPSEMVTRLIASGMEHTYGDMMAMKAGTPLAERFSAATKRFEANVAGKWTLDREGMTKEEREAALFTRVGAAWIQFKDDDKDMEDFAELVGDILRKNQEKNPSFTTADVVRTLSKREELAEWLEKDSGPEVEIDEM